MTKQELLKNRADGVEQDLTETYQVRMLSLRNLITELANLPDDIDVPEMRTTLTESGIWLTWKHGRGGTLVVAVKYSAGSKVVCEYPVRKNDDVVFVRTGYTDPLRQVLEEVVYPKVRAGVTRDQLLAEIFADRVK